MWISIRNQFKQDNLNHFVVGFRFHYLDQLPYWPNETVFSFYFANSEKR